MRSEISHFITHATKAPLETIAGSHGFSMKAVREEATKIKEKRRWGQSLDIGLYASTTNQMIHPIHPIDNVATTLYFYLVDM